MRWDYARNQCQVDLRHLQLCPSSAPYSMAPWRCCARHQDLRPAPPDMAPTCARVAPCCPRLAPTCGRYQSSGGTSECPSVHIFETSARILSTLAATYGAPRCRCWHGSTRYKPRNQCPESAPVLSVGYLPISAPWPAIGTTIETANRNQCQAPSTHQGWQTRLPDTFNDVRRRHRRGVRPGTLCVTLRPVHAFGRCTS